jgi:hypothetical protein
MKETSSHLLVSSVFDSYDKTPSNEMHIARTEHHHVPSNAFSLEDNASRTALWDVCSMLDPRRCCSRYVCCSKFLRRPSELSATSCSMRTCTAMLESGQSNHSSLPYMDGRLAFGLKRQDHTELSLAAFILCLRRPFPVTSLKGRRPQPWIGI